MTEELKKIESNPDCYIDSKGNVYDSDLKMIKRKIRKGIYVWLGTPRPKVNMCCK